ncbi:MAG: hypothetical protein ACOCV3_06215 [Halanaerobiales bacterium]
MQDKKWYEDYLDFIYERKKRIYYREYSAASRRIRGQVGTDRIFKGYRSVLLYFKLSKKIDLTDKLLDKVLCPLKSFTKPDKTGLNRFATLFLNNSDYELIYPEEMVNKCEAVKYIVNDYYQKYLPEMERYNDKLKQLFPFLTLSSKTYPTHKDLCLFFQDKDGIEITEDVGDILKYVNETCLWITVKGDEIVALEDGLEKL